MENVLPTETTQHQNTTTTHLIQQIQKNTTTQVEAHRVNHLITDIISQFKLLMEYLPEHQLDYILTQLTRVKSDVEAEITGLNFEFETLKEQLVEMETPCNPGGGCV